MSRERSDAQNDERALVRAFRSLIGIWPFLSVLATGAAGVLYFGHQWDGVGKVQDAQTTRIELHEKSLAANAADIRAMQNAFAAHAQDDQRAEQANEIRQIRLEAMVQSIREHYGLPPLAGLPSLPQNAPLAGSAGVNDEFLLPPHAGK